MLKVFLIFIFFLAGECIHSQTLDYAREIVNTLSSGEYMGRGYCGSADLHSAEYIRNEFRKAGILDPGNKYFQFFRLNVNTFPDKMEVILEDKLLVPGKDYLVDPSCPTIKGKFKIFRITRSELLRDETFIQITESGADNCILIDLRDTIKLSKEESEYTEKKINAIKYDPAIKNCLTLIFSKDKLSWSISDRQSKKAVIILNSGVSEPGEFSEIKLNIKAKLRREYRSQNVVGYIRGKSVPDSFLVLTAHYDHLGIMGRNTIFPGANDNASGVAMMLSLCRYFSENPPSYSMVFIAFSAEEAGLVGSQYFTEHPLFPLEKIKFLVNYDLAGTGDEGIKVVNATVFAGDFERLKQINSEHNFLLTVQARGPACISDHCVFYLKKVPCFYIYTLGGISAYHDIYDRAETLPLSEFEDYYELMTRFLMTF